MIKLNTGGSIMANKTTNKPVTKKSSKKTVPQAVIDRFETGGEGIRVVKKPKMKRSRT